MFLDETNHHARGNVLGGGRMRGACPPFFCSRPQRKSADTFLLHDYIFKGYFHSALTCVAAVLPGEAGGARVLLLPVIRQTVVPPLRLRLLRLLRPPGWSWGIPLARRPGLRARTCGEREQISSCAPFRLCFQQIFHLLHQMCATPALCSATSAPVYFKRQTEIVVWVPDTVRRADNWDLLRTKKRGCNLLRVYLWPIKERDFYARIGEIFTVWTWNL